MITKQYIDEIILAGKNVRSFAPTSSDVNVSDTAQAVSAKAFKDIMDAAIAAAIADAEISGGTTLTGWYNVLAYGAVTDGGFSSGTDNSPAINAMIAAAPAGSQCYIPPGHYRCLSTINIPSTKHVHLKIDGTLYFGTNTGFILDGNGGHVLEISGRLNGTNQGGTPNYTGQSNAGVYIRNCRNAIIILNQIHGFEDAIRIGGYATGSSQPEGSQYNKISWAWLWRNKRGIHFECAGGTTVDGNWANSNFFWGGQISGEEGIRFTKDTNMSFPYDNNEFYNVGFEYSGNGVPMTVGICGGHTFSNNWFGGRFEPAGVVTKIALMDGTGISNNNNSWHGWFLYDSWLVNCGNGAYFQGAIQSEADGRVIGPIATGYPYNAVNVLQNGRIKIHGTARLPTMATKPANVDIVWDKHVTANATAGSYTPPYGITRIICNNSGASNAVTLPDLVANRESFLYVMNVHATGITIVNGTWTLQPGTGAMFYADTLSATNAWRIVGNTSSGSSSSQWTTAGAGINYNGPVGIGAAANAGARLSIAAGSSSISQINLAPGSVKATPVNGDTWNDGNALYYHRNNTTVKLLELPPGGGALQMLRQNELGTGAEYIDAPVSIQFVQLNEVQRTEAAFTSMIENGLKPLTGSLKAGDTIVVEGGGNILNQNNANSNVNFRIVSGTYSKDLMHTIDPYYGGVIGKFFTYTIRITAKAQGTSVGGILELNWQTGDGIPGESWNLTEHFASGLNTITPTFNLLSSWETSVPASNILKHRACRIKIERLPS